ncbi:hypothetical protein Q5H93_13650 [Hymenobacter sp. ASUV-10]|uniref:T9SS type A sorting domain-containing protein n=1 Tax=Hymenobacter aranciens TaxID=3063996 RepID=A0ABT9BDP2_9BACT|nr:hypothetical protein [Hymenobacter sp. ASUV-10]MDO7875783.1 hypothetical protein [Hymenobacter sp. ASUV-10]
MGHCLGLGHSWWGLDCPLVPGGPLTPGENSTNNIMDYPWLPGLSLSQCQIGKMHYYLGHEGGASLLAYGTGMDNLTVSDYCQQDGTQDITIPTGSSQVWEAAHNTQASTISIEDDATLIIRCRIGVVGPEMNIKLGKNAKLILDRGTLGNFATSEQHECPQDVFVYINGAGGLVEIQNGGGFISEHLRVAFYGDVSLHIPRVPVLLDGAQLYLKSDSYLCLEPGAEFTYRGPASFNIDASTTLGLHAAVQLNPAPNCTTEPCKLAQTASALRATVAGSNAPASICAGNSLLLEVYFPQFALVPTVEWRRNGSPVSPNVSTNPWAYTDSPDQVTDYEVELSWPGTSCAPLILRYHQQVLPNPSITLSSTQLDICGNGTEAWYLPDGRLNLNDPVWGLIRQAADPAIVANQGGCFKWADNSFVKNGIFDPVAAAAQGPGPYTLSLGHYDDCYDPTSCFAAAEVTLNIHGGPVFQIPPPDPVCAGNSVRLTASAANGITYHWQPGNLTGSSVTVTPATTTTYTVTGTGRNSCPATQQVTVTVQPATCLACLGNNYKDVSGSGPVLSAYTFASNSTYVFNTSTILTTGTFVVEEGARLLFGPGVRLTLVNNAQLVLAGGTLTALCTEMWDGIVATRTSRGVVAVRPTGSVSHSEISHSRNGLIVQSDQVAVGFQPTLQLTYVAFLHNGQSIQLTNTPNSPAFTGLVTDSRFDSDPQQMRAPWQYQSARDQHVTLRHFYLDGNCAGLTVSNSRFDHSLYDFWMPAGTAFTASNNEFHNFYIAAVFAHDYLLPNTRLSLNKFYYPVAANEILLSDSPQLQEAYGELAGMEGAEAVLRRNVCVGIYGTTGTNSTSTFTLEGCQFFGQNYGGTTGPTTFTPTQPYAQYGVVVSGGILRNNTFQRLQLGYQSTSTQTGGIVKGNAFENCYVGLNFRDGNGYVSSYVGSAEVSCNSFTRTQLVPFGPSYGIFRDFCQRRIASDPCTQINLTSTPGTLANPNGTPRLLKNEFVDDRPAPSIYNPFWHVWNGVDEGYTTNQMQYYTFTNRMAGIVGGPQSGNNSAVVVMDAGTDIDDFNDCEWEGYDNGLQFRPSTPLTTPTATTRDMAKPFYLAQNVPNPCTGTASVTYRAVTDQRVELVVRHYISGQVLRRQAVAAGEHTTELNLQGLLPGPYHYTLEVGGQITAHRNVLVQ